MSVCHPTGRRRNVWRRNQRDGQSRPPAQARLGGRRRLRDARRLHKQVIEAALTVEVRQGLARCRAAISPPPVPLHCLLRTQRTDLILDLDAIEYPYRQKYRQVSTLLKGLAYSASTEHPPT